MRRALPALLVALAAIVAVVALRACGGASTPARPVAPAVRPGLSEADEHAATLAAARAEEPSAPEASATPAPPASEPPPAGATRGLVIDRRTGEPVNDVLVRLRAFDGGSASARTGTDGRFEARAIESAKPLEVTVLDDDHELESEAVGEPTDLLVRVEIGPTYVLRDFRAAVLDEWRAQVIERRPETPVAGRLRIFESSLELMPDEDDDLRWTRVRVRPGPDPWVRYARVEHEPQAGYEPFLRVERDRATGSARARETRIDGTIGVHVVTPDTERTTGDVVGRIVADPAAGPFGWSSVVVVLRPGANNTNAWWSSRRVEVGEAFEISDVPPGEYVLVVYLRQHRPLVRTVHVRPVVHDLGTHTPQYFADEVDLELFGERVDAHEGYAIVFVADAWPFAPGWVEPFGWVDLFDSEHRRAGGTSATFRQNLPSGRFRLFTTGSERPLGYDHGVVEVDSVVRDRVPARGGDASFGFVVRADGVALERYQVHFVWPGSMFGLHPVSGSRRWPYDEDAPIRWLVAAPGYAPVFGDEGALAKSPEHTVPVDLTPGWGCQLYVREWHGGADDWEWSRWTTENGTGTLGALAAPPIVDVEVLLDGLYYGATDEHGALTISLPGMPAEMKLVAPGWRATKCERVRHSYSAPYPLSHVIWLERR